MNRTDIWMVLSGTSSLLGLDWGFWVAMAVVALIAVLMNVVCWGMVTFHGQGNATTIQPL